jgi:hypothetical protein
MQHNKLQGSIMNFAVKLNNRYEVIQHVEYAKLNDFDVNLLCSMYNISIPPAFVYKLPEIPPGAHMSTKKIYVVPVTVALPRTTNNEVKNYWHRRALNQA